MILSTDKEYQSTKQIMLGKEVINPDFNQLAHFIDHSFNIRTINIIYETFENQPRLNICFEFENEVEQFYDEGEYLSFDKEKQKAIAEKFKQTVTKGNSNKFKTDNAWVYYSAFEPIARSEANESIPQDKIEKLKLDLNCQDLWQISRFASGTTFFVNTGEQLKQYKNNETRRLWADKYFDILEPYDEFGYFVRDNFDILLDSKENFDKNYQSNWYYYYK